MLFHINSDEAKQAIDRLFEYLIAHPEIDQEQLANAFQTNGELSDICRAVFCLVVIGDHDGLFKRRITDSAKILGTALLPLLELVEPVGLIEIEGLIADVADPDNPSGLPLLIAAVNSPNDCIRIHAATYIGIFGEAVLELIEKLAEDPDPEMQEAVINSAQSIGVSALPLLERLANNLELDETVSDLAREAISHINCLTELQARRENYYRSAQKEVTMSNKYRRTEGEDPHLPGERVGIQAATIFVLVIFGGIAAIALGDTVRDPVLLLALIISGWLTWICSDMAWNRGTQGLRDVWWKVLIAGATIGGIATIWSGILCWLHATSR